MWWHVCVCVCVCACVCQVTRPPSSRDGAAHGATLPLLFPSPYTVPSIPTCSCTNSSVKSPCTKAAPFTGSIGSRSHATTFPCVCTCV